MDILTIACSYSFKNKYYAFESWIEAVKTILKTVVLSLTLLISEIVNGMDSAWSGTCVKSPDGALDLWRTPYTAV